MRNSVRFLCMVGVLSFGLAACANSGPAKPPPQASGTKLTNEDITAMYMSGQQTETMGKSTESGNSWVISRNGNGAQSITVAGSNFTDSGTYWIEGDTLCNKWQKIRDGSERCSSLYSLPDGTYESANEEGERVATFRHPVVK